LWAPLDTVRRFAVFSCVLAIVDVRPGGTLIPLGH
jgi:hypothetical protein